MNRKQVFMFDAPPTAIDWQLRDPTEKAAAAVAEVFNHAFAGAVNSGATRCETWAIMCDLLYRYDDVVADGSGAQAFLSYLLDVAYSK